MVKAHRLLSVDRADLPKLAVLAPSFAVSSACSVVLASLSKALFLSQNPIALLPWMFLGSALLTALCSLAYVATMRRFGLTGQLSALLLTGVVSLIGMRVGFPARPSLMGILILLWCPALGQLLLVQVWNLAATTLPTRQGKRLFPLLAAVATLGAAAGGGVVQLSLRWLRAEDLLVVTAILLVWPLFDVRRIMQRLGSSDRDETGDRKSSAEEESERGSELGRVLRNVLKKPLLSELALFAFLMQAASLVVDYQLSAELQHALDKEGIAGFLGTFYWMSNVAVLGVTLFMTSRLIRTVGLGVALAMSGIAVGLGSAVYVVSAIVGAPPAFWVIAATAFAERIAQYGLTKPATQMVYMPLATRGGERAKTLIEGVVHRFGTMVVSVLLLVVAPDLGTQFRLSPPVVVACIICLYLGVRMGPHYRREIFEALRARRIDASVARYLRDGLDRGAGLEVEKRVRHDDPRQVLAGLDIARELQLELPEELLEELLLHENDRIARAALRTTDALSRSPSPALLERMLEPQRPPRVLRAVLELLSERADDDLAELVRPLTNHADPGVASAACVLRIRAAGGSVEGALVPEVASHPAPAAFRVTGTTRAGDFARELPELLHNPDSRVRRDAVEQMGQLVLPFFIEPLIMCLSKSDVRQKAIEALMRHSARVLPHAREHFTEGSVPLTARIGLLQVLERLGSDEAVQALVDVCRGSDHVLRDHATEALWRLADDEAAPRPSSRALRSLMHEEMRRLETYAAVEVMMLGRPTPRRMLFHGELMSEAQRAERRAFRLLGLLYEREAMHRAYLNYRSKEQRTRSNAIELLEQHIADQALKKFVTLVEKSEDAQGRMRPRSIIYQALTRSHDIDQLLEGDERWLERVWRWAVRGDSKSDKQTEGDGALDELLALKQIPMFKSVAGEQLLPLVHTVQRTSVHMGDRIIEQGEATQDVYWVADGEVEVVRDGRAIARLGMHECFGEMAALDGGIRSATVRALAPSSILRLGHLDFLDALDLNPAMLRALIGLVSKRLRRSIAKEEVLERTRQ
jgi:HEAT repeat protein